MEEKKRLWVQTKMDPCFYKMILYKVASMAEVWCRLDLLQRPHPLARWLGACGDAVLWVQTCCPPCFSFRCRSPGAHIACYFFTIHSYLLLSRSGRGSWLDALAARLKGQPPGHGLPPGGGAQGAAPPGRRESLRGEAP